MKNKRNIFSSSDCLSLDCILRYLHEESSLQERHRVEKHMLECALCKEAVEGYALMGEKDRSLRIVADLNKRFIKNSDTGFELRKIAAGIAAVLVLGGGLLYLNSNLGTIENTVAVEQKKDSSRVKNIPGPVGVEEDETIVLNNTDQDAVKKENIPPVPLKLDPSPAGRSNGTASGTYQWETDARVSPLPMQKPLVQDTLTFTLKDQIVAGSVTNSTVQGNTYKVTVPKDGDNKQLALSEETEVKESRKKSEVSVKKKSKESSDNAPASYYRSDVVEDDMESEIMPEEKKNTKPSAPMQSDMENDAERMKAFYDEGVLFFDSGKWEKAIGQFNRVETGSAYYEEARWKKALALIKKGDLSDAKLLLQEISKSEGPYKTKAVEELKKLN